MLLSVDTCYLCAEKSTVRRGHWNYPIPHVLRGGLPIAHDRVLVPHNHFSSWVFFLSHTRLEFQAVLHTPHEEQLVLMRAAC